MELLEKLAQCVSVSGRESAVREIIEKELKGICDEIYTDALGNLICHKKGNGKKLMLAAHMDEIGLIVTFIDKNGFLRFSEVGGALKYNCINTGVVFQNGTRGTISYENKENPSNVKFDKMYIDIGAKDEEDAKTRVNLGDVASFDGSFSQMGDRVMSKALDDRAGCWALIRAIQSAKNHENDIYAVFTAQEELGLRGAKTAAYAISPDMAVAVDVSNVGDTPFSLELNLCLGKGPAIKIKDASFIIHSAVRSFMLDAAKSIGIDYQIEAASYGGTDAGAIHLTGGGVPSGTISIPTRYIHSPHEVVDTDDLKSTASLLKKLIETPIDGYLK